MEKQTLEKIKSCQQFIIKILLEPKKKQQSASFESDL